MDKFAKALKNYLVENDISFSAASRMCGVDRTLLGRYANGVRRPKNVETVAKIARGLEMNDEECRKLEQFYLTDMKYEDDQDIFGIIEEILSGSIKADGCSIKDINAIRDKIGNLLSDAKSVYIYFDNDLYIKNAKLKAILNNVFEIENKEIIIGVSEFDNFYGNESEMEMLKVLKNLLPFMCGRAEYRIFSKSRRKAQRKTENIATNYIVTDKDVFLFDDDMAYCFFSEKSELYNYYKMRFENTKVKCRLFAESLKESLNETILENAVHSIQFENSCDEEEILLYSKMKQLSVAVKDARIVKAFWKYAESAEIR